MLESASNYISISRISSIFLTRSNKRNNGGRNLKPARAGGRRRSGRGDISAQEEDKKLKSFISSLRISKTVVVRSAAVVFALGFIDAGYSGDWSRIGVVSKETEDLLKTSAYFVVPLCILLFFISNEKRSK